MKEPTKEALHEEVDEYANHFVGEPGVAYYLHEQIDNPEKRNDIYSDFIEYIAN